jgi:hypothetical protein
MVIYSLLQNSFLHKKKRLLRAIYQLDVVHK